MSVAPTVGRYLDSKHAHYDIVPFLRTGSSAQTAEAAQLDPDALVKAILVEDDRHYALVLLPASMHLELGMVRGVLGRQCGLAMEHEVAQVFDDCDRGAVPAVGQAYGVQMLVDDHLREHDLLYLEGGKGGALLRVSRDEFNRLMGGATRGPFASSGDRRS